jgi:hypothetical protein
MTGQTYLEHFVKRKNLRRKYSVVCLRFEVIHEVSFERTLERYI